MPRFLTRASFLGLTTFAVLYLAACNGKDSMTPTGSSSASRFATIAGTVDDGSPASGTSGSDVGIASRWVGIKVTVVETGESTETNQSGQFVITVPAGTVTLRFEGHGLHAELEIAGLVAGQTLTITVHASGSHAHMGNGNGNGGDDDGSHDSCFTSGAKAEVEGLINATATDSITVRQQGKGDFLCLISSSTRIRKGNRTLTVDDLVVGKRVHVKGTGMGDATGVCQVAATEIKLQ